MKWIALLLLLFTTAAYTSDDVWPNIIREIHQDYPDVETVVFITDMTEKGQLKKDAFLKVVRSNGLKCKVVVRENWSLFEIDEYLASLPNDGSTVIVVAEFTYDNTGELIQIGCGPCYLKKFNIPVYVDNGMRLRTRKFPLFGGW